MAFAVNGDLLKYVPSIFDHGVQDFTDELNMAESDVKRKIETDWFNKHYSSGYDVVGRRQGLVFDSSLLTESQWNRSTVYYALYAFILPQLATWRPDGDAFVVQIEHYRNRFAEEFTAEMDKGVEYDFNDDGTVDASEKIRSTRDRLYR